MLGIRGSVELPSLEVPQFKDCAKVPQTDNGGFILYYTSGCPYTAKYVPVIENYALFYNGEYVMNEVLSEKKFQAICEKLMN